MAKTPKDKEELTDTTPDQPALAKTYLTNSRDASVTAPMTPPGDRYTLMEALASGTSGVVWLARDRLMSREVAIKVLHSELQSSENLKSRFLYEAKLTARLGHPGVVPVFDLGQLADGRCYFAMERIEGHDLKTHLENLRAGEETAGSRMTLSRLLQTISRVGMTVAYAHNKGYLHRDLKPANILIGDYGEVFVADWGLAKPFDETVLDWSDTYRGESTQTGTVLGTIRYMSPEQVKGEVNQLTPASDVFSLGVMLFECLSLATPFKNRSAYALMMEVISQRATCPETTYTGQDVPAALQEIVNAALSLDPTERPTARELAEVVASVLENPASAHGANEAPEDLVATSEAAHAAYVLQGKKVEKLRSSLKGHRLRLTKIRQLENPESTLAVKRDIWRITQELDQGEAKTSEFFVRAVKALEERLEKYHDAAARHTLGELYRTAHEHALERNDGASARYFLARLDSYDGGDHTRSLTREARLGILVQPHHCRIESEPLHACGPLAIPGSDCKAVNLSNAGNNELLPGHYALNIEAPGYFSARLSLKLGPREQRNLQLRLPRVFPGAEEYVFVAGGKTTIGGDMDSEECLASTEFVCGPMLLGRFPVTLEQYLTYLNDRKHIDLEEARSRAPKTISGRPWVSFDGHSQRFVIDSDSEPTMHLANRTPLSGVTHEDAEAYCAYLSRAFGVEHRLPTEQEWEFAARGMDGRTFPWGNGFDPCICCAARPENTADGKPTYTVDTFPHDVSALGLRHMGGLVREWTASKGPKTDTFVIKGGSVITPAQETRCANRASRATGHRSPHLGFRVARALE